MVDALKVIALWDPTPNYQGAMAQQALASLPEECRNVKGQDVE